MIDVLMDLFDLNRNFSLPKQNKQTVQQQKKNREKTGFIVRSLVVIILVSFFSTTFLNSNEKKNRMDFHVLWRKNFFFSTIFISIFEVVHNWLPKGIHQSIKFLLVCLLFPTTLRKHKTNTHIMEYFWENKKLLKKKFRVKFLAFKMTKVNENEGEKRKFAFQNQLGNDHPIVRECVTRAYNQ